MRKKKEKKELLSIDSNLLYQYQKSNVVINAKGRASIMSLRLFALSIKYANIDEKTNSVVSVIPIKDLIKFTDRATVNSLYNEVYEATVRDPKGKKRSLLDWRIVIEDKEQKKFLGVNVIQTAEYKSGVLTVRYNSDLTDNLVGMKSNYTTFDLRDTAKMQSAYSFRFYELAKSQLDYGRAIKRKKSGSIDWKINLVEFQYRLGVLNPEDTPSILKELGKEKPDYDRIINLAKENNTLKYPLFSNFKRRILDKAIKEVNEYTPLDVTYDVIKGGRGAKVKEIVFHIDDKEIAVNSEPEDQVSEENEIYLNDNNEVEELRESDNEVIDPSMALIDIAMLLSKLKIPSSDIKTIAEVAGYDVEKVKKAYEVAKKTSHVKNVVGFIIKAIREDYEVPVEMGKEDSFTNFEQRTYDYDELEKRFVKNRV